MGVMSALIFALQMINFTIPGGTSGHLLGGALAAIILGPHAGAIAIAVVLIVQALIFMDGGIVALGSNIFNMAIVGVYGSFLIYWLLSKISKSRWMFFIAIGAASWLSVVAASFFCRTGAWYFRNLCHWNNNESHAGDPCNYRAGRSSYHNRSDLLY